MKNYSMLGLLAFLAPLFLACSLKNETHEDVVYQKYMGVYSNGLNNDFMLVYDASCEPKPTVMFIHGGGWQVGAYHGFLGEDQVNFFKNNNINVFAINYSLSPFPNELENQNRIKHPSHVRDVVKSIKWLIDNAQKYNIDTSSFYVMGHSSGAHLATLLGTNHKYLNELGIDANVITGVISLDGGAYLTHDMNLMSANQEIKDAYINAFTEDEALQYDATPYNHIAPDKYAPSFLFICSSSELFRLKPNAEMHDKLIESGFSSEIRVIDSYHHLSFIKAIGTKDDTKGVGQMIVNFINKKN